LKNESLLFILSDPSHRPSTFFLPQSLQQTPKLKTATRAPLEKNQRARLARFVHICYTATAIDIPIFYVIFILLQHSLLKMLELAALMYYSEQVWTVKQN